jgi:hypothetical protein
MSSELKTNKNDYPFFGFSMSLFLHALIITAAAFIMNSSLNETKVGSYVQLSTIESKPALDEIKPENENNSEKKEIVEKNKSSEKEIVPEETKPVKNSTEAFFYNFSDSLADTTNLVQVYKENTLNVSIKYPAGWTYLDQDVRNKLDGVTFWTSQSKYNPPPYVHVEVKDKDLFNPKRFQHRYATRNYAVYYNDPEELAGQVNQIIYIRTNTDEDYSLKLIMNSEEAFKSFQPVFFGMVKSFKYGSKFF